jgi:hypothetical protein
MRSIWKMAAIVATVAILGVAGVGVVAYAQEASTGSSAVWDFGQSVKEAIAEALGISVDQYEETVAAARQQVLDQAVAEGQLTQEQADRMQQRQGHPGGFPGLGMDRGSGGGSLLMTVAADQLGMTEAELRAELRAGKSIADLAVAKGVDTQAISDAYLAQLEAELDAQVADGSLTQNQADARLEQESEALPDRLTGTWTDMGRPGRGGHGGRVDNAPGWTGEDEL